MRITNIETLGTLGYRLNSWQELLGGVSYTLVGIGIVL